jgi:hypothetical protein
MKKDKPANSNSRFFVAALAIVALAFVSFFILSKGKGTGELRAPGGFGLKVKGEEPQKGSPGVSIRDAQSGGNVRARDESGRGVELEKVKAEKDIEAVNSQVLSTNGPPKN